ncbi:MAG: fibronectin type III domain-containing protein [Chloroflexi bacterium]|nr:fibronectin type III domain-containing protein [Chloroflexota bacterium]
MQAYGYSTQIQDPQSGIIIHLWDLVPDIAIAHGDGGNIDLGNLDPHQTYEVMVSTSNPSIVGIGDCLGASRWTTFRGSPSRSLWFAIRGCAQGQVTVTIEVFPAGVDSPAARLVYPVTAFHIPSVVPHQRAALERAYASLADVEPVNQNVRNFLAGGIVVQRPFRPNLTGFRKSATATATIVSWHTWWASAPTGGVDIIGYQMRYWPDHDPSRISTVEITDGSVWQYRITGLVANTSYKINMRACTNQEDCTAAEQTGDYEFRTPPG